MARTLAAVALGVSLLALVLAGWAVKLGQDYLEDVQTLGDALREGMRRGQSEQMPMNPPPPKLEQSAE